MPKQQVSAEDLARLCGQDGLITSDVLRASGISRSVQQRLIRDGLLVRCSPSLFTAGVPAWTAYAAAALRIAGDSAAIYGSSALALHGLGERKLPVHVVVAGTVQPRDREWACFHRSILTTRKILGIGALPRVGLDDSVVDAIDLIDEISAIALIARVVQERRTTAARLLRIVEGRSRVRHREIVVRMLEDGAGIESALEHVYAVRVERAHHLEPMERQYVVPETAHRADGAYPERRALIHLDGARFHDVTADRELDNRHAALGYTSLRFTWADCWGNACVTARLVAGDGRFRACRRCTPPRA